MRFPELLSYFARVEGLRFKIQGLGFRVYCLGSRD